MGGLLLRTMAVEEHENPLVESMEKNEPMTGGKVRTETSASIKGDDASITIDPEGVKTSNRIVDSQQSIRFSLDGAVPPGELHVPPGVDTPFTFGTFIKYFGPGWLVCIAYCDPGNYQACIQSGSQTGYSQNWVILWTSLLSWYVQYMCVKLQHYTNTNLAEAMALQYPKYIRWAFWVIAEISIILTDLPEVIGFAIAINLFNDSVPLYAGVLLSFLTTMAFLASLHRGSYFIELVACVLVLVMAVALFVEWGESPMNAKEFAKGAFLPIAKMTRRHPVRDPDCRRRGHAAQLVPSLGNLRDKEVPTKGGLQEAGGEARPVGPLHPNPVHNGHQLGDRVSGSHLRLQERRRTGPRCLGNRVLSGLP